MKVFYSRISTQNQNDERQLQDLKGFDYVLADKCSGLIPLFERPNGSQLRRLIDDNKLTHLEIHSIDRLGRSLLPCLEVWNELTSKGITVVCRNPMLRNIDENGKPDKFSELMMSILATMSTYEKSLIKERQMEGIAKAKAEGVYKGRKPTIDPAEVRRMHEVEGLGATEIARKLGIARTSVYRVLEGKAAAE